MLPCVHPLWGCQSAGIAIITITSTDGPMASNSACVKTPSLLTSLTPVPRAAPVATDSVLTLELAGMSAGAHPPWHVAAEVQWPVARLHAPGARHGCSALGLRLLTGWFWAGKFQVPGGLHSLSCFTHLTLPCLVKRNPDKIHILHQGPRPAAIRGSKSVPSPTHNKLEQAAKAPDAAALRGQQRGAPATRNSGCPALRSQGAHPQRRLHLESLTLSPHFRLSKKH
ncbi:hypothetical protein P7K49_036958 [Saguinus oedipus]|uniref:Uncharacterized protein n=1 Tax=Saguinus oedipus TaxID=9490 RepID=A0ABQ9TMK9_SAGOE|nr:hypothetical protein P7K49_036958 [Saguinus oedipus]